MNVDADGYGMSLYAEVFDQEWRDVYRFTWLGGLLLCMVFFCTAVLLFVSN